MKAWSVALLLLAASPAAQAQLAPAEWTSYSYTPAEFTLEIPKAWEALPFGEDGAMFTIAGASWLEEGIPAPKHPWLVILRSSERCFDSPPGKIVFERFRALKSVGMYREGYACKHNLEVIFGFWEGNSESPEQVFDFKRMLESLKRPPVSR